MIQAPIRTDIPPNELWKINWHSIDIKYALVKTEFKVGSYPRIKNVTLAYIEIPNTEIVLAAGTIMHDDDNQSRPEGRGWAIDRLVDYCQYGKARKHKNGKPADHFIIEITKEEILNDPYWKNKCAQLILKSSFLSKTQKPTYNFSPIDPTYGC